MVRCWILLSITNLKKNILYGELTVVLLVQWLTLGSPMTKIKEQKLDLSVHFQHKFPFSTRFKGNTPASFLGSGIEVAHVNGENQEMI